MKITEIKQQIKRKDKYSIYIDGKYSFPLSEGELLKLGLAVGQEFDEAKLSALKDASVIDKGVYRVLDLISRRARSEWEITDYLKRKKYEPEEIDKVLNALNNKGYINDEDFARRWVENRRLLKPTSKRKLQLELRQKHVSDQVAAKVLEADETSDSEVLKDLIVKKRSQSRYADQTKLMQYLARQGFNYQDIKTALDK